MTPHAATTRRITLGLVVVGTAAGAIAGAALTVLGKIVAGAPPATPANYAWNMAALGLMAGIVSPIVTLSGLRRVPLWRTVTEPLLAGVAGAAIGVMLGSGPAFLLLPPIGIIGAFVRLHRAYRGEEADPLKVGVE